MLLSPLFWWSPLLLLCSPLLLWRRTLGAVAQDTVVFNKRSYASLNEHDPFRSLYELTEESEESREYLDSVFPRDEKQAPQQQRAV